MDGSGVTIRKFQKKDRPDVRRISCETAILKEIGNGLFSDDEILADALTMYYTDYEPDSCFVAEQAGRVIGYIIGSKNMAEMNRIFRSRIAPKLFAKVIRHGIIFKGNDMKLLLHCVISFIKGEFSLPDLSKEYPATLHINIDKDARGLRLGSKLIEHYLDFLKKNGAGGVHFGTTSEGAKTFFTKTGFNRLYEIKRTFLKYVTGKDMSYFIFGRKL